MANNLKIGYKVKMVNCSEANKYKDKVWIVSSEPFTYCLHEMVYLKGKIGAFSTSCLERVLDESWKQRVLYCNPPQKSIK